MHTSAEPRKISPFSLKLNCSISFYFSIPRMSNLPPEKTLKCEVLQKNLPNQCNGSSSWNMLTFFLFQRRERGEWQKCTAVWIETWIFNDFFLHSRIALIQVPTERSLVNSEWIADALNPANDEGGIINSSWGKTSANLFFSLRLLSILPFKALFANWNLLWKSCMKS